MYIIDLIVGWFLFMVFNATSNNISVISWRSVLLGEEIWVSGENNRPVVRHWQSCIEYTSPWTGFELTTLVVMSTDYTVRSRRPHPDCRGSVCCTSSQLSHFIDHYIVISFLLVVSNRKKNKQTKTNKQKTAVGKVILI
jgi:hypothetical protein